MILEDFIMLGTTVPEPNSDGRIFVCSAGYSPDLRKIIRIYPLGRRTVPKRWHQYQVSVERNPKDHRDESFRIRGDRGVDAHDSINNSFKQLTGRLNPSDFRTVLDRHLVGSIKEANERRLSLAIIKPTFKCIEFDMNPDSPDSPQEALFDMGAKKIPEGSKRFPFNPRVLFTDDSGGQFRMQLRDWGSYELMRKKPDVFMQNGRAEYLAGAVRLNPDSTLLIGNLNNHRTTWIIISVLNGLRNGDQVSLFDDGMVG